MASAAMLTLAACKYEEGPGITLRSKTDRVANEWKFTKYTYDGNDALSSIIGTDFNLVLNMYRTGDYGIVMIKPLADGKYETTATGNNTTKWNSTQVDTYINGIPAHVRELMNHGYWNFDKRHFKIQIKPELSHDPNKPEQSLSQDWTIVMLKEKMMKVWGMDKNNKKFEFTFEPLNGEPYWF